MPKPSANLPKFSRGELEGGIARFRGLISELKALNITSVEEFDANPKVYRIRESLTRNVSKFFKDKYKNYKAFYDSNHQKMRDNITNKDDELKIIDTETELAIALIEDSIEELEELLDTSPINDDLYGHADGNIERKRKRKVFVVHGHDAEPKLSVARLLEKLGFEAIILHEQANGGRTIIEKFEDYADVGFAVVLLTPDDDCVSGTTSTKRARQNVVLELGYFTGKLGRDRVCVLRRGDVEIPSDILGVVYTPYDDGGSWQYKLAQELKAADYEVDMNKIA